MTAARTVQLFGLYLLAIGVPQVFFPDAFYSAFGKDVATDYSALLLGAVTVALGFYYLVCAHANVTIFFQATVVGRLFVSSVAIVAVWNGLASPTILTHFTIEIAATFLTAYALWREGHTPIPMPTRKASSSLEHVEEPVKPPRTTVRNTSEDRRFVAFESSRIAGKASEP